MDTKYSVYTGKILQINLTSGDVGEYNKITDNDREMLLGGKGISTKILLDLVPEGADPLGPENVIVISCGALNGTISPCSSRFDVSCKSPLTGGIASSNSGGNFGINLRRAGFDGVVILGKAKKPVYIKIVEGKAEIVDASGIWGLDTQKAQEKMGKKGGKLVIGPAGENKVRYACMASQERITGRGGVGAVAGSKNLKGLVAMGNQKTEVVNIDKLKKASKKWIRLLRKHPVTGDILPGLGTANLVNPVNATSTMPTKNFSSGQFENAYKVSGEYMAEKYLIKNEGCLTCPIHCGRRVKVGNKVGKGPEYESIALLGPNLGIDDMKYVIQWSQMADLLGMDSISMGATLGFAMELKEKGMMPKFPLSFGKSEAVAKMIEDIAHRRGIGKDLAEGTQRMAEKYGGKEFAINAKGLELAGYEPRMSAGMGLGYATANRGGCHLNAGYLIYQENIGPLIMDSLTPFSKASWTVLQQNLLEAINLAGECILTTYAAYPAILGKLPKGGIIGKITSSNLIITGWSLTHFWKLPLNLIKGNPSIMPYAGFVEAATGIKLGFGKFARAGERSFVLQRLFNIREGITGKDDALPARLTDEPQRSDIPRSKVPLGKMLPGYYRIRGWDKEGIPKASTMKRLGLDQYMDIVK